MLKKSLLASIAFATLSPTQASQVLNPHPAQAQGQNATGTSNCPPCPCGGVNGWVLIPAGPGMPCNQGASEGKNEEEVKHHHHEPAAKRSLHPLRTPEQEQLEIDLRPITPHIYLRANPDSPDPTKKEGEWGKALNGKVYFRHLGNWVYDPSVNATTDIIATGVKARAQAIEEALKKHHQPQQRPKPTPVTNAGQAEGASQAAEVISPTPKPATSRGYQGKHWEVNVPGALGTTERPNPVKTEPTMGGQAIPAQGEFNGAQTNISDRNKTRAAEPNQFIPAPPPPPPLPHQ